MNKNKRNFFSFAHRAFSGFLCTTILMTAALGITSAQASTATSTSTGSSLISGPGEPGLFSPTALSSVGNLFGGLGSLLSFSQSNPIPFANIGAGGNSAQGGALTNSGAATNPLGSILGANNPLGGGGLLGMLSGQTSVNAGTLIGAIGSTLSAIGYFQNGDNVQGTLSLLSTFTGMPASSIVGNGGTMFGTNAAASSAVGAIANMCGIGSPKALGASFTRSGSAVIDYDGSPTAYGPNGLGDDHLANAGGEGNWWGVATSGGQPIVNPQNGHYVSTTAWSNGPYNQQSSYVNAEKVPYVAMTASDKENGVKMGDFVLLTNSANGQKVWAVVADFAGSRSSNHAEISPAAARALGVTYVKGAVTSTGTISQQFYPGSANGTFPSC